MDLRGLDRPILDLGRPRPHVESFFIKANHPTERRALWVRLTLLSDGEDTYGETWAVLFDGDAHAHLAAKERWPKVHLHVDPSRSGVGMGSCRVEDGESYGLVRGDGFAIGWKLALEEEVGPYLHFPSPRLYASPLVGSKIVSPMPCAKVRGEVELWRGDGRERFSLDGWRGMHGHNWGKRHADDYVWAHCNTFDGASGAFFEGFSARARIAGWKTPPIVMGRLVLDGETYRFDTWRHLLHGGATSAHGPTSWRFTMRSADAELSGVIEGEAKDTVGLSYANPKAEPLACLNSKLARLSLTLRKKGGTRELTSHASALEVGTFAKNHGIDMVL